MSLTDERKKQLRRQFITARKNTDDKAGRSLRIAKKLIADPWYAAAKTVALYKNLPSEVDTEYIICHALGSGKRVVLPKVFGSELRFFCISADEKLIKSDFGVLEPAGDGDKYVPASDIDLAVVPGVCFDREKNRLGFGRGYYDRFLSSTKAAAVGICFSSQLTEPGVIPVDIFDVKMQKIITEDEIC